MLGFFDRLLGRRCDRLAQLARRPDRERFVRRLGQSDIFIIAAIEGDGLDPSGLTREQLLAAIELAAKDLSQRKTGFAPLVYMADGLRLLPFFSSDQHAQEFCSAYSTERNRVYPFQVLGIRGSLLAGLLPACDALVLNDRSPDQYILSKRDLAELRRIWGAGG